MGLSKLLLLFFTPFVAISAQVTTNEIILRLSGSTLKETKILADYDYSASFSEKVALKREIKNLTQILIQDGYIDIREHTQKINDSLYETTLKLGAKFTTTKLIIPDDEILQGYIKKTGFSIANDTLEMDTAFAKAYLNQLSNIAANNGDPFAKFRIVNISKKDGTTLIGSLTLFSQAKRTISELSVIGYNKISKSHLKQFTKKLYRLPYNQNEIKNISQEISTLAFVKESRGPEVLFTNDSTKVFLYLEKENANKFDGFLGFANNKYQQLRLDGYLDLQLTNNLNYGEQFTLNYKSDGDDQSQLKISARLPYILRTPIGLEGSLSLFRQDSTFSTTQNNIDLFYKFNNTNKTSIGYFNSKSEDLRENTTTLPNVIISNFKTSNLRLSHSYEKTISNKLFPEKTTASLTLGIGRRRLEETEVKQQRLSLNVSHIFQLNSKNSVFIKSTSKILISPSYVTNELFRFGGITSIRGFEENSLFANLYTTLNTEYRYQINNTLLLNTIIDLGYLESEVTNEESTLFSAGIGSSIRTKAGILKINLANGVFKKQDFSLSNTKLHLILAVSF